MCIHTMDSLCCAAETNNVVKQLNSTHPPTPQKKMDHRFLAQLFTDNKNSGQECLSFYSLPEVT